MCSLNSSIKVAWSYWWMCWLAGGFSVKFSCYRAAMSNYIENDAESEKYEISAYFSPNHVSSSCLWKFREIVKVAESKLRGMYVFCLRPRAFRTAIFRPFTVSFFDNRQLQTRSSFLPSVCTSLNLYVAHTLLQLRIHPQSTSLTRNKSQRLCSRPTIEIK